MKDFSLLGSESKEGMKNNESANNRTIILFRPEVKSSLQMSGVKNRQKLHLGTSESRKTLEKIVYI